MIVLKNVSKDYGSTDNIVHALKDVSIQIKESTLTAIIGKSGSGKSTLMNIIGALDKPTTGEVLFNNQDITNLCADELAKYRSEKAGFVFQSFFLEPSFSVLENVCMPLTIAGIDRPKREEKAIKLLTLFDVLEKKDKLASELSAGQKQRVSIARALMNDPMMILADEPTGNLDSENGQEVMKRLKEIARMGKMVVLVTHNLEDAKNYADTIIELKDGEVLSVVNMSKEVKS